jgi:hypothetical protein
VKAPIAPKATPIKASPMKARQLAPAMAPAAPVMGKANAEAHADDWETF